jgi:hypothetical protein
MPEPPITAEEFKKRLAQLCLKGNSTELPSKQRDRRIILKSIALCLAKERTYTEREMNAALMSWVGAVGHSLQVDHAALRRALIDEQYLERTLEGGSYRLVGRLAGAGYFEPEVEAIQPAAVIDEAIGEAAAKREQFRNRNQT